MFLEGTPREQVEPLVGTAQLHTRFYRNGVIALHQGVQYLAQGYALPRIQAAFNILARDEIGDREDVRVFPYLLICQFPKPFGISPEFRFREVENFPDLRFVRFHVLSDRVVREHGTFDILVARIPDDRGEISCDKYHLVPQFLEVAKFQKRHRAAGMDVRTRGVNAQLDTQALPDHQKFLEGIF